MRFFENYDRILWAFAKSNAVGWIDPDGDVHRTDLFGHMDFFLLNETALPEVTKFLEPLAHQRKSEQENDFEREAGNERPAWHGFEVDPYEATDEELAVLRPMIYGSGWGRIGCYGRRKIELECSHEHEKHLSSKMKLFAEMIGRTLTVSVVDFDGENPKP